MNQPSRPRILIADDDPDILAIVTAILDASSQYELITCKDGNQALEAIKAQLPDLAILDLSMPGADGAKVCKTLREMPDGKYVPVMILTARDGLDDKVRLLSSGADDYVTKPFHHSELMARVKALLRIRALNVALAERSRELERTQAQLVQHERQLALQQIAGSAAHALGQPLAAILLNLHLLESLNSTDPQFASSLAAIKLDVQKLSKIIEQLKAADGAKQSSYHGADSILDIE